MKIPDEVSLNLSPEEKIKKIAEAHIEFEEIPLLAMAMVAPEES
nr:hypothetical protein [Helicobacter pylori]